eukprot:scaffold12470_cov119-Isochrysis_galbana.AAC.12
MLPSASSAKDMCARRTSPLACGRRLVPDQSSVSSTRPSLQPTCPVRLVQCFSLLLSMFRAIQCRVQQDKQQRICVNSCRQAGMGVLRQARG